MEIKVSTWSKALCLSQFRAHCIGFGKECPVLCNDIVNGTPKTVLSEKKKEIIKFYVTQVKIILKRIEIEIRYKTIYNG